MSLFYNTPLKKTNGLLVFFFILNLNLLFSQNSSSPAISKTSSSPNVLFIIADDLGLDALFSSDYGISLASQPTTPNIQSLKNSGVSFLNTWATPQCTTTRASIMSGKYGINTGVRNVPGNLDLVHESVFTYLNNNLSTNYAKAVIGKWHISSPIDVNHPYDHGVDHYEGVIAGTIGDYYSWDKVDVNGQTTQINEYVTEHFTDSAINWISNQTDPWFLWLAHIAPHSPFHIPPTGTYSQSNLNGNRRKYIAAIESLDYYIGELLAGMDQATRDNTIIIFIGDNGTPNGVSRYFPAGHGKASMYEGGLRVPMIISGHGVTRQGEFESGLVQVNDIHATIIELLCNDLEGGIYNSYSVADALTTQNTITRPYIYSDYIDNNVEYWAIRNDTYKLIENENGGIEFYNVVNDLEEVNNLIGMLTPQETVILNELQAEAAIIRSDWSCVDEILNGTETTIDDCCITTTTYTIAGGWDNGIPDVTKEVIITESYNTTDGNLTACSLTIAAGATLTIEAGEYISVENSITVDGTLIVEHQGSIVQIEDAAAVTNNGTIQVAITTPVLKPRDFMMIGSAMTGVTREGDFTTANKVMSHDTNLFVPNPAVAAAFPLAENFVDDNFNDYINHTGVLNAGEGYLLRPRPVNATGNEAASYTFTQGTLNNGIVNQNIIFQTDQNSSYNLLSNPYASAINATDFINANTMIDAVYFWEHVQMPSPMFPGSQPENFSMEDVSMFNLVGGVAASSDPTTTPNGFISTAQGFGIKASAAGTAVFNNAMREVDNNNTLRNASEEDNKIWLTVTNNDYNLTSCTLIGFMEGATSGLDAGYDSNRIATAISLYSHLEDGGMELGIQGREGFDVSKVIAMGFTTTITENTGYEITLENIEGVAIENTTVYLVDTFLNKTHNLSETEYRFTTENGVQNNRFLLKFEEKSTLSSNTINLNSISLYPNPTKNKIHIVAPNDTIQNITIIDINGSVVYKYKNIAASTLELDISTINSSIYFMQIETSNRVLTKKIVKE